MTKPKFKKGDKVEVDYEYTGIHDVKTTIVGTVDLVYRTTFGGSIKEWGVRIRCENHPICRRKFSTFRANKVRKAKKGGHQHNGKQHRTTKTDRTKRQRA